MNLDPPAQSRSLFFFQPCRSGLKLPGLSTAQDSHGDDQHQSGCFAGVGYPHLALSALVDAHMAPVLYVVLNTLAWRSPTYPQDSISSLICTSRAVQRRLNGADMCSSAYCWNLYCQYLNVSFCVIWGFNLMVPEISYALKLWHDSREDIPTLWLFVPPRMTQWIEATKWQVRIEDKDM